MQSLIKKSIINKKVGFTLAEILITLGVIGVVAAMTIPTVLQKADKDATIGKLKKEYSALSQTIKLSETDNTTNSTDWPWPQTPGAGVKTFFDQYFAPYLSIAKNCPQYTDCGYTSNGPWKNYTTLGLCDNNASRVCSLLNDGSFVMVKMLDGGTIPVKELYIDLNGSKAPNTMGKDAFAFTFDTQKGLVPFCNSCSDASVTNNCSSGSSRIYCSAKIMRDGWKIVDDYPWDN